MEGFCGETDCAEEACGEAGCEEGVCEETGCRETVCEEAGCEESVCDETGSKELSSGADVGSGADEADELTPSASESFTDAAEPAEQLLAANTVSSKQNAAIFFNSQRPSFLCAPDQEAALAATL